MELVDPQMKACKIRQEARSKTIVLHESISCQYSTSLGVQMDYSLDQHAKSITIAHVHKQRTDKETQTLAVSNLLVVQAEAL